jgi:hypothetical protein
MGPLSFDLPTPEERELCFALGKILVTKKHLEKQKSISILQRCCAEVLSPCLSIDWPFSP